MTRRVDRLARFAHDTQGATLLEMAMVMPLLLLLIFGLLDYGRLFWIEAMAQKATAIAARTAAVRPPVCAGVPTVISVSSTNPGEVAPKFGTLCRAGGVCADGGEQSCLLDTATAAGAEIWDRIAPLMPPGATAANVRLRYSFDERIGFLGGPYSPMVTAELVDLAFQFATPLGGLAAMAANDDTLATTSPNSIALPAMSVSLPGEDLAAGLPN